LHLSGRLPRFATERPIDPAMKTPPPHPDRILACVWLLAACWLAPLRADNSPVAKNPDWLTGQDVNLGGILFPDFHFTSTYGGTTGDQQQLRTAAEDPQRDGWSLPGFEFGLSARTGEYFDAFGTFLVGYNSIDQRWEHEFEEWFGKIKNIPGGFELRGGKYLNRFGFQNSTHNHGWDYADQYLVNGRFLGDDGLATIGGELTWTLPVSWTSLISVSIGVPPPAADEEQSQATSEFNPEQARFDKPFVVANWTNNRDYNDFHQFRGGLSGAWGENESGKTTQIYGAHLEYQWRQNGYEPGGRYFRWRNEAMLRSFGAVSEPAPVSGKTHSADLQEFGLYSALTYGLDNGFEFGLRGDFVSGIASAGLDERFRLSPSVTYYLNRNRTMYFRTQYNYDHGSDFGNASSVWAQVGINWGGPEVR
jgi:hypothetical protein